MPRRRLLALLAIGVGAVLVALVVLARSPADPPFGAGGLPPIRPYLGGRLPAADPRAAGRYALVDAFPRLILKDLLGMVPVPRSDRLVIFNRQGIAWTIPNDPAAEAPLPFLDLSSRT